LLKRPLPGQRSGPADAEFNDADFSKQYPTLSMYLTLTKYEKGESRVTSTLLIFLESNVLRVCLNDRDNNRSVFVTGETVESALMSLENGLLSDRLEWRTKNWGSKSQDRPTF